MKVSGIIERDEVDKVVKKELEELFDKEFEQKQKKHQEKVLEQEFTQSTNQVEKAKVG